VSATVHRVLIVDDEPTVCDFVRAAISQHPDLECVGIAGDGATAVECVRNSRPDVVVMDIDMPYLDGARATELITREHPDICVLAHTGHVDPSRVMRMIVAGAVGYILKGEEPGCVARAVRQAAERRAQVHPSVLPHLFTSMVDLAREERARRQEAERLNAELQESFRETVCGLMAALESRDDYTHGHDDRVGDLALAVARRLGVCGSQLGDVEYGALFHDIGKIAIPDSILHGRGGLSAEEWDVVKQHTVVGERIMRPMRFLRGAARVVRHSHEHWDGTGYPDGLRETEIPLGSRIVLACDAFDAMTTDRSYRNALGKDEALRRLRDLAGEHFDTNVVNALCAEIASTADAPAATPRNHEGVPQHS